MTVTFSETLGALYGDLVDVDVLAEIAKLDDPSSAHVPGVLKIARKRKAPVDKGMKELVAGSMLSLRRQTGVHVNGIQRGLKLVERTGKPLEQMSDDLAAPKTSSRLRKPKQPTATMAARPTPKEPGNRNVPAASTTDKVRGARAGAERLMSTTEGKVATGVAAGGLAYGHSQHKKATETSSPYAVYKMADQTKRRLTAGASAVGAAAGVIGTAAGLKAVHGHGVKEIGQGAGRLRTLRAGLPKSSKLERGLLSVEPVGLAGEVGATTILHGDTKNKQPLAKAGSFSIAGTFSKFDTDKQRAYGWASVVEVDGVPVVDRQGDVIDLDDLEEAAYVYVRKSRVTGDMHRRTHDDLPHRVGELIESVVFTPDKCEAMGVSKSLAGKWWMGVQVEDVDAWELVKKGERTGFSIHGKGIRKATTLDDVMYGGR